MIAPADKCKLQNQNGRREQDQAGQLRTKTPVVTQVPGDKQRGHTGSHQPNTLAQIEPDQYADQRQIIGFPRVYAPLREDVAVQFAHLDTSHEGSGLSGL